MSAIEKDREIAATLGTGPWRTQDPNGNVIPENASPDGLEEVWVVSRNGDGEILLAFGAEEPIEPDKVDLLRHIVRLHNRQPLYDAAATLLLAIASDHEYAARARYHFNSKSAYASIGEWRKDHDTECDVCRIVTALDAEQEERP